MERLYFDGGSFDNFTLWGDVIANTGNLVGCQGERGGRNEK